ncbi:MAG: hypothetical protein C4525_13785 [Desulfarculus sp.]|nr:MAG: hypothetical protein C4525_13785 [Desulfarculus sp.]
MSQVYSLCAPGQGLSCFACCPPIRPAGYDHAAHQGSLRRLLADNTAAVSQGRMPGPITGFWCPGLGFLDRAGRQVGCLLHPARHQGQDLRGPTGYAAKCGRESCAPARAFAELTPAAREALLAPCAGMDSFAFSSPRLNPVMRLLAFGPKVAAAAAGLRPSLETLRGWAWLWRAEEAMGWLLGRALGSWGAGALAEPGLNERLAQAAGRLAQALGPSPPLDPGQALEELAHEWEARCWRTLAGRRRARPAELARWRALVERALE